MTPPLRKHGSVCTRPRGFTLLELLLAVLIAGILASVAYPAYQDQVRKGRRSDAISALGALQLAQERYRASNPTYAVSVDALGRPSISEGGHYDLSVGGATASSYQLVATARAGSSQSSDAVCFQMAIVYENGGTQYRAGAAGAEIVVHTGRKCWRL